MAVVVATRMVPSKLRHLPAFLVGSMRAGAQAQRAAGFRAGRMRIVRGPAFWTLTVWQDGRHMSAYRDSGVHAKLAPHIARWAKEAAFTVWQTDNTLLPSWREATRRMADRAVFAPLENPNERHIRHELPKARYLGLVAPMVPRRFHERRDVPVLQ
jgi:hypothetical protein